MPLKQYYLSNYYVLSTITLHYCMYVMYNVQMICMEEVQYSTLLQIV